MKTFTLFGLLTLRNWTLHAHPSLYVANIARLAAAFRDAGAPVIFSWFIAEENVAPTETTPLWEMVSGGRAMIRGSWGAAPAPGVEPQPGDLIVEKLEMNPIIGSRLGSLLRGLKVDTVVCTGTLTNYSVVLTAAHASDLGYRVIACSDGSSSKDDDWHNAALKYEMPWIGPVFTCAEDRPESTHRRGFLRQRQAFGLTDDLPHPSVAEKMGMYWRWLTDSAVLRRAQRQDRHVSSPRPPSR